MNPTPRAIARSCATVAVLVTAACGGSGQTPQEVGAGVQDIVAEGGPSEPSGQSSESAPPAGGEQGAGVYERGGDIDVVRGQQSFVGQDVIIRGTIAQLVVGNRAFMVMPESGGGESGGQQGAGGEGGQSQQGGGQGGSSQESGGEQGGQSQQGGSDGGQVDCFAQPGTCLLVVLDPAIDAGTIALEEQSQVELAGSVVAFEPSAVEDALRGETGDFDFERYPGGAFLIVRILEVQTAPAGGAGGGH